MRETFIYEIGKNKYLVYWTNWFFFDIGQTSILFNKEKTKAKQPGLDYLHVSQEKDIKQQRQLDIVSRRCKAIYF